MAKTRRKRNKKKILRRKTKRGGGKEPKEFKLAKTPSKLKRTATRRKRNKSIKKSQSRGTPFTIGRGDPRIKSSDLFNAALISTPEQQEINDDWGNYIKELQTNIKKRDELKKKKEKKSMCVIC